MSAINMWFDWNIPFLVSPEFSAPACGFLAQVMRDDPLEVLLETILIVVLLTIVLMLFTTTGLPHLAFDPLFSTLDLVFWASSIAAIFLLAFLVLRQIKGRQKQSVMESVATAERRRIARDLHDTVLKTLEGLALETYTLQKHLSSSVVEEKLRYVQMISQQCSGQIREVVRGLRNGNEEQGIASQLSRMLEDWSKAAGIETEFILTGADRNFPLMINYNLRNVLSEALANIHKHASASHVRIFLKLLPGELKLEVHDNGCGLGTGVENLYQFASCEKFGILGMKERVEQLDGHFSIENSDGTRLVIMVPIPPIGQSPVVGLVSEPDKNEK